MANVSTMSAEIYLTDDRVGFEGALPVGGMLRMDAAPPVGKGEGDAALTLFLMSLASCAGITAASLIRDRVRRDLQGMRVSVRGNLKPAHPKAFEEVWVHLVITSQDLTEAEMERVIDSSENKLCPVLAMIRGNVKTHVTYVIERPPFDGKLRE